MKTATDITERINKLENNLKLLEQSCDNQNKMREV